MVPKLVIQQLDARREQLLEEEAKVQEQQLLLK